MNQGYFMSQGLSMGCVSLPMIADHVDGFIEAVGLAIEQVQQE